ncbi:12949_t:CDS:2, partial [Gigaspora rosea]
MSTAGEKVPLPTVNEVKGWSKTEQLINFLRAQNLGLEDKHFNILREQEINGISFLRMNADKLMKYGLKGGPTETIAELIEKIKGERQVSAFIPYTSQKLKNSNAFPNDSELKSRLENAWVFNISYENGNSLRISEQDAYLAVGTRMLLQLFSGERTLDNLIGNYEPPSPWDVLALIAKYEDKKLEDATVILVVDGLHNIMSDINDGLNKNSSFYRTLTNIGDLSLSKTF